MSTNIVVILLELTFLRGRERKGEKEKGKEEGEKGYHTYKEVGSFKFPCYSLLYNVPVLDLIASDHRANGDIKELPCKDQSRVV